MGISRRVALSSGVLTAAGAGVLLDQRPSAAAAALRTTPFTLGVASGDPSADGFVIWTRLATHPLSADGHGGMGTTRRTVGWEVATDEAFAHVVRRGVVYATYPWAHSVHVTLRGLRPGREYWYRFRQGGWHSRRGRAITTPAYDASPASLRIAAASCANYAHGYFTAYRRIAEARPDLWLHLGDYIYEYGDLAPGVRTFESAHPIGTLEGYRRRYARYHGDPDLQMLRAATPLVAVFDDHEVANNWVSDHPRVADPGFVQRRAAGFRAYYENQPLRDTATPRGAAMNIVRRIRWGDLTTLHMLDTRQWRDDQACDDGLQDCPAADDPNRTALGTSQRDWLAAGLRASQARWDVLGQQIFYSRRDADPGPGTRTSMDTWDGYTADRYRVTDSWLQAGVRNAMVLSGDVHAAWASEVRQDFLQPDTPSVGTEFSVNAISSSGDGYDGDGTHPFMAQNPHLVYYNNLRGWTDLTFTPTGCTADFRVIERVSSPGAEAWTRARYVVEDGAPLLNLVSAQPSGPMSSAQRRAPRDLAAATIREETRGG